MEIYIDQNEKALMSQKNKILWKVNLKKIRFKNVQSNFIGSVIKLSKLNERNKDQQDDFIIPLYLFEEPKPRIAVESPFWELNEKRVSTIRKRFNCFTNNS